MDKFVIKTQRSSFFSSNTQDKKPRPRQATLHSLSGVVVIEQIIQHKNKLESSSTEDAEKVAILKELVRKSPSTQVLVDTGIGRTVRSLRKSSEGEVKSLAEECYKKWKLILERRVELSSKKIEVQSDKETTRLREASTKFLASSLGPGVPSRDKTAVRLEKEIYRAANNLVSSGYRRLSRRVIFALKSPENQTNQLNREEIKALVNKYVEK